MSSPTPAELLRACEAVDGCSPVSAKDVDETKCNKTYKDIVMQFLDAFHVASVDDVTPVRLLFPPKHPRRALLAPLCAVQAFSHARAID